MSKSAPDSEFHALLPESKERSKVPSPAPSANFTFVPRPTDFRDDAALVVRMPRGIRSKQKLFAAIADKLRFPKYFGWNWDAFEECLRDLSWLPQGRTIVLVHEDLPFGLHSANRESYFNILRGLVASRPDSGRPLIVVLPSALRDQFIPAATGQH